MPILAPGFREFNFSRIHTLKTAGYSDTSIASVINDETDNKFKLTAVKINGYLEVTSAASSRMLISKKGMKALMNTPTEPVPE
jgi:translation initiation factor 2 alpha subunit (eIF-2alpha)